MRYTCPLICASVLLISGAYAQTTRRLDLQHATVFLNGALLENTATLELKEGENQITFTNVAYYVNTQNIIINATNGVAVESSTYQNAIAPDATETPLARKLQDSIAADERKKIPLNNKLASINDQLKLLETDISDNSDDSKGASVEEIGKMIDLIAKKKEALLNESNKATDQLNKLIAQINQYNDRITKERERNVVPGGELVVKLYARTATTSQITVKYTINTAGWSPAYDVWVDNVNSPMKLYYKANIHQNTGIDWTNVKLTLSTGNPQEGMQLPTISPWHLSLSAPPPPPTASNGQVVTAYKRPLVEAYESRALMASPTTTSLEVVSLTPGVYQQERGAASTSSMIEDRQAASSMNSYVAVDNSGVNTTFDIELPYTIPNDNQQHFVAVKEYSVPATYRYFSIPKLDRDAFLRAEVASWNELSLLPGPTNIFYEGTYIGQGSIDPRTIQDTMYVSLGRDKKIVIKREQDKQFHSIKKSADEDRDANAFIITVRNSRKESAIVQVQDQLPVSNDKELAVDDVDLGGGDYDTATGTITWTVALKAGESRKLTFSYSIRHPRDRQLIGMR